MATHHVCTSCAAGLANDDWTHLDASCCCPPCEEHQPDCEAERLHTLTAAFQERAGWLTPGETVDMGGYYNCDCCWEIECGRAVQWHSEGGES